MADTNKATENIPVVVMADEPAPTADNAAGLEQIKGLLKTKDDTSRFVGLALLKSVLDTQAQLREDVALVSSFWESMSPNFIAKLLKATKNEKTSNEEAKNMVDIAVAVLHMFVILLPEESREDRRFVDRIGGLVNCLLESSPETTILILQTLSTLVSRPAGAVELLNVKDKSPLIELSPSQPLALDVISSAWMNAAIADSGRPLVNKSIDTILKSLVVLFKDTDAVTLLSFVADTLAKLPSEVIPESPSWLNGLILLLRKLVVSRPTSVGRAAYTQAAAALLQAFPHQAPTLLFETKSSKEKDLDVKPFTYLFINLLLIDIRSSYPSLLPKLNSADYPALSKRLSAAFDVVSSFVGYLIRSLDDEGGDFIMPPDLLLKLRKDIAETIALTCEYLRDRYDAAVAGALGLDTEVRGGPATYGGTRLQIAYDSIKDDIPHDTLVLASIRTLAIWLREDENEKLRGEAAGLTDLFTALYKASEKNDLDFRFPILTALEATLTTEQGIDTFLEQETWDVFAQDLANIVQGTLRKGKQQDFATLEARTEQDASRGIEIIRVLLAAVDDERSVGEPPNAWMAVVPAAAGLRADKDTIISPTCLELEIAIVQLATALLSEASPGLRKKYQGHMSALRGLMNGLREKCRQGNGRLDDLGEAVEDAIVELENLR